MKRLFAIGIVLLSLMGCGSRNAQKSTFRRVRDEIRLKMQDFYLTEINRNNL